MNWLLNPMTRPFSGTSWPAIQIPVMRALFAIAFIRLGMLGMAEGTPAQTIEMRVWTLVYFGFFILLFFISPRGKTKPLPERLTH